MKTKNIINILIVAIIIVSIMIVFKTAEKINKEYAQQREREFVQINEDDEQGLPQAKPEDSERSEESEGNLGGSGGAGGAAETSNITGLPSDLYTRPCSFYFSEYGVCAGTCPSGTCTQEGQSCYCRED